MKMKKLVVIGTILTMVMAAGTAAFAASTAEAVNTTTSGAAFSGNLSAYRCNGTQDCQNFVDADGDGVCDYGAHNGAGRRVSSAASAGNQQGYGCNGAQDCQNFVDADGDGVCDYGAHDGKGHGNGAHNGKGHGANGGHNGKGHGNGHRANSNI